MHTRDNLQRLLMEYAYLSTFKQILLDPLKLDEAVSAWESLRRDGMPVGLSDTGVISALKKSDELDPVLSGNVSLNNRPRVSPGSLQSYGVESRHLSLRERIIVDACAMFANNQLIVNHRGYFHPNINDHDMERVRAISRRSLDVRTSVIKKLFDARSSLGMSSAEEFSPCDAFKHKCEVVTAHYQLAVLRGLIDVFTEQYDNVSAKYPRSKSHSKDMVKLRVSIADICKNTAPDYDKINEIIDLFINTYSQFDSKGKSTGIFGGTSKAYEEKLNTEQGQHHYQRLVGLLLHVVLVQGFGGHLPSDARAARDVLKERLSNIECPDNHAYQAFKSVLDIFIDSLERQHDSKLRIKT